MGDFFFGLDPIRVLQELSSPLLDAFFLVITSSGSLVFFMAAVVLVYWLWDKRVGLFLIVLLLVSGTLNAVLKAFFGLPRPPAGLHKTVPPLTGNGFPSGHAQTSTAFWSAIALISRGWWIPLAVAMITLVAFSRVYLGVHFVGDVLGGVAIGLGLGLAGYVGFRASFWGRLRVPQRLVLAVVLPAAFSGILLLLGEAAYLFWGLLTGLGVGYVLEEAWVGMERARTVGSALLRVAIGIPAVGGLALLGMRFSDPMIVLPLFLVLGFAVSLVLPWAFLRLEKALSTNR